MFTRSLCRYTFLLVVVAAASALFAQSGGLRFEVSFPKSASAAPLDGHVFLLISTNNHDEPRFQIAEDFADSQQAFGLDVDGLAPDTPATRRREDLRLSHAQPRKYSARRLLRARPPQHLRNLPPLQRPNREAAARQGRRVALADQARQSLQQAAEDAHRSEI